MKDIFKYNRYPDNFIGSCIERFFHKLYVTIKVYNSLEKKQVSIASRFLGEMSYDVRKWLQTCVKYHLPMCTVRTAFQSKTRLSSLFKFKDCIPKNLCSHIFLKFLCSCCNATYYRQMRDLFVCSSRHLGLTSLTGKRMKNPKKSAFNYHIFLKGHVANYVFMFRKCFLREAKHLWNKNILCPNKIFFHFKSIYFHAFKSVLSSTSGQSKFMKSAGLIKIEWLI